MCSHKSVHKLWLIVDRFGKCNRSECQKLVVFIFLLHYITQLSDCWHECSELCCLFPTKFWPCEIPRGVFLYSDQFTCLHSPRTVRSQFSTWQGNPNLNKMWIQKNLQYPLPYYISLWKNRATYRTNFHDYFGQEQWVSYNGLNSFQVISTWNSPLSKKQHRGLQEKSFFFLESFEYVFYIGHGCFASQVNTGFPYLYA